MRQAIVQQKEDVNVEDLGISSSTLYIIVGKGYKSIRMSFVDETLKEARCGKSCQEWKAGTKEVHTSLRAPTLPTAHVSGA